ncbi:hypothetical protein TNCV_2016671 [Trichonephila clavipes]|nr:hypothetical protein TNCV_2016671 [Trichonephila clavipes]
MFRTSGQSAAIPPVFKSPSKLLVLVYRPNAVGMEVTYYIYRITNNRGEKSRAIRSGVLDLGTPPLSAPLSASNNHEYVELGTYSDADLVMRP